MANLLYISLSCVINNKTGTALISSKFIIYIWMDLSQCPLDRQRAMIISQIILGWICFQSEKSLFSFADTWCQSKLSVLSARWSLHFATLLADDFSLVFLHGPRLPPAVRDTRNAWRLTTTTRTLNHKSPMASLLPLISLPLSLPDVTSRYFIVLKNRWRYVYNRDIMWRRSRSSNNSYRTSKVCNPGTYIAQSDTKRNLTIMV